MGPAVAKELIFTSRALTGQQAREYGIVNHSVEQNEAGDAAYQRSIKLAEEILPNVGHLLVLQETCHPFIAII